MIFDSGDMSFFAMCFVVAGRNIDGDRIKFLFLSIFLYFILKIGIFAKRNYGIHFG